MQVKPTFWLKYFIFVKKSGMSAIVIKADNQNTKILKELAKKLGADVLNINEEQYEDLALGLIMDKVKTGETVSRDSIMKKLDK
jgi:5-bromo-4-chloroindolyl phosphate hydrolysis protein